MSVQSNRYYWIFQFPTEQEFFFFSWWEVCCLQESWSDCSEPVLLFLIDSCSLFFCVWLIGSESCCVLSHQSARTAPPQSSLGHSGCPPSAWVAPPTFPFSTLTWTITVHFIGFCFSFPLQISRICPTLSGHLHPVHKPSVPYVPPPPRSPVWWPLSAWVSDETCFYTCSKCITPHFIDPECPLSSWQHLRRWVLVLLPQVPPRVPLRWEECHSTSMLLESATRSSTCPLSRRFPCSRY